MKHVHVSADEQKNYGSIALDLKTYPFMLNVFPHPYQLDVHFQF